MSRAARFRRPSPALAAERMRLQASVRPTAREMFPILRERLLASRPVIGEIDGTPVYGEPTFRNVIENGVLR
ncbi:hypothetical protein [Microbacterium gilvum]|uniref:Uncharacterized protein n=1 Tax=Microbacterium gilvum TaxID=1336204 RepID=A0ABP8ZQS7_9MICO